MLLPDPRQTKGTFLLNIRLFNQVFECEEMAASQETSDRVGPETRLERLLGVSQRYHATILSMRLTRRALCGGSAQAPHHCGWSHYAAHTRTPQTRSHILPEHCVRRCIFIPSTVPSTYFSFYYLNVSNRHDKHKTASIFRRLSSKTG